MANAILYQANASNAVTGVMGLNKTTLNTTALDDPASLLPGPINYNYIVLLFRPTETENYIFGQTSAPVDTVMIFYQNRFNASSPGTGALVGNDDTPAAKHKAVPGLGATSILCGNSASVCPQVTYDLTAGRVYTILISTYAPNAALPLPQNFYSSGPGDFGSFNNLNPIDTTASYFLVYDLDFTVKPQFSGGILRIDQVGQAYSTAFTLSNLAGNTLDEYNNHVVLSGVFSDLVAGQPGVLTLVNSLGSAGSVTLSGTNTFTGGLTLGTNSLLHISNDSNLGAAAAKLTFNGGTLNPTAALTSARTVTLQSGGGTIDTNVNTTLTGVISGTGGLIKKGTGTLTLGGNNNYTGNTTISAGTLQIGNGATTGSIVGDIINNSRLVFNHSNTHIHAGQISGTGSLTQAGTAASVTVLTADNNYTGGTTISSGALRIGNGGNTGSVVGNILNNASLIFNRSGSYTYSGVVSGTGSLTQAGAAGSITTLSNNNNYTGGTTISSGTLKIGAGGSTGSVVGNILNNSALVFDRSDELIYSGIISGTGSLTQSGAGTLSLGGVNSYSGPTLVGNGVLKTNVANAFANSSSVTVNSGTTLNLNNFAQVANNLTGSGSVLLGSAVLTENSTSNSTFSGVISGTGSLIKTGASQLTLSGTNNYTGGTSINAGTLSLTSGGAAGSGAVTTNAGTLNLNFASNTR